MHKSPNVHRQYDSPGPLPSLPVGGNLLEGITAEHLAKLSMEDLQTLNHLVKLQKAEVYQASSRGNSPSLR